MEQWVKTKVWRMKSTALFVSDIYLTLLFVLKGTMTAKIGTEMEIVQEGQLLLSIGTSCATVLVRRAVLFR